MRGESSLNLSLMRLWVRQAERDRGERAGLSTDERARLKALEREVGKLRQADEIPRKASAYFAAAELDPPVEAVTAFIGDHREAYGIEPICKELPIAPSKYHAHAARCADPSKAPNIPRRASACSLGSTMAVGPRRLQGSLAR